MNNIASIFRFYTPFLDFAQEKKHLVSVMKKVAKLLEGNNILFTKKQEKQWNYYKMSYVFDKKLWKIEFLYISGLEKTQYFLPLFRLEIFLHNNFLLNNTAKKNSVSFLNNIFECFDGINEKEFLIDIADNIYYKEGLFGCKTFPHYDFCDIESVKKIFENKWWSEVLENFITKHSQWWFILSQHTEQEYRTLHWIFLYFVYLIYLMHQNHERTGSVQETLLSMDVEYFSSAQTDLFHERLSYLHDIHNKVFEQYKNRLELFFTLFK